MKILIIEPFFTGSHAAWAKGYARYSRHDVSILDLSGNHWKWRMHGGAVTLARRFLEQRERPDLLLATDMLDLTTFLALTRTRTAHVPSAIYFHENQLTYPWSPKDRDLERNRDQHYGFINLASALAADRIYFNSSYHMESVLCALPAFLGQFPDHNEHGQIERLRERSSVLPLGFDFESIDASRGEEGENEDADPLILWNHRWEYDKNPDDFVDALRRVADRGRAFRLSLLGEAFDTVPEVFERLEANLSSRIVEKGYVDDRHEYYRWLWRADILPVTSNQDFFGVSVIEAVHCGCFPLLPRRLAFPELIPADLSEVCFYRDLDDLVDRLDRALCDVASLAPVTERLREATNVFDWRRVAAKYDDEFDALLVSK